ncbi:4-hydroxy-tetrahydrodipicolinate reductase [Clostridia bacterium]|nr:4-hydroxy-tetrahydrodipicolinate reductase [Clostridia bacterium]
MIKTILHGCGAMGQVVSQLCKQDEQIQIVAGIDLNGDLNLGYPIYQSVGNLEQKAEVIIDFSYPDAIDELLEYCLGTGTALVLCTTGLSKEQYIKIEQAAAHIPLLRSANMSLGINLLQKLLKQAAVILEQADFDIEIIEKHHRLKIDAPSGTAIALAETINDTLDRKYQYIYDRSNRRESRHKKEIGIQALRGGSIVGEHEVIFAGNDEVLTLSHTAYSKAVFAKGAIQAAKFLAGKAPGYYDMSDVVG